MRRNDGWPSLAAQRSSLLDEVGAARLRPLCSVSRKLSFRWRVCSKAAHWAAGRAIAAELRDGGLPPVVVASDGTIF